MPAYEFGALGGHRVPCQPRLPIGLGTGRARDPGLRRRPPRLPSPPALQSDEAAPPSAGDPPGLPPSSELAAAADGPVDSRRKTRQQEATGATVAQLPPKKSQPKAQLCKSCRQDKSGVVVAPCFDDFVSRRAKAFLYETDLRFPDADAVDKDGVRRFAAGSPEHAFVASLSPGTSFEVRPAPPLLCPLPAARVSAAPQLVDYCFFHAECGHMLPMDDVRLSPALVLVATPRAIGISEPAPAAAGSSDAAAPAPPRVCLVGGGRGDDDESSGAMTEWRLTADGYLVWTSLDEENAHRLSSRAPLPAYRPWAREALVAAVAIPAALSWLHTQVGSA